MSCYSGERNNNCFKMERLEFMGRKAEKDTKDKGGRMDPMGKQVFVRNNWSVKSTKKRRAWG